MALRNLVRSWGATRVAGASFVLLAGFGLAAPALAGGSSDKLPAILQMKRAAAQQTQNAGNAHTIVGSATTQTGVVTDPSVSPFLLPDSAAAMQAAADKYAAIVARGGWPSVPSGKLKAGSTGSAATALNRRLAAEGYLAASGDGQTFTAETEAALKQFQRNMGLAVTGQIDGTTLTQLNVSAERRLATIRANIPRIAEYTKDLGERYVVVNVPAMQIETVSNGRVYSRHNAIVGRPSRPTPVVMTPLATVRFNPYWNAPASIVERDIVPRMLSSKPSRVLASMNMKVFNGVGGPEVNPDSINWRSAVVDNYHFRQEPGGENAMATAKIEFNSPFGIYLHDTPEPQLFKSGMRFYSSGCVRVEKVATLIDWILQGQDGIDKSRIAELADTKERLDETIANPPQLRVAYLTAWPTRSGVVAFRPDIYELDGSGFVVGQPMPVGDSGPRYVLKPIPRSAAAVDADEAQGFGGLFRRWNNPDKDNPFNRESTRRGQDGSPAAGAAASAKTTTKVVKQASRTRARSPFGNSDNAPAILRDNIARGDAAPAKPGKKKLVKDAAKAKAGDKTKVADKSKAKAKDVAAAKKVNGADQQTVDAKKADTAKKLTGAACKPDKAGKLPDGCKPAAPAKKPVAKPEQTASATN